MSKLLDPKFKYVPAAKTDIRKTFARVRRELAAKPGPSAHNFPAVLRFRQRSD